MARPERWLAIVNPAAGRGRPLRAWPRLAAALAAAGVDVELATTAAPLHAVELVRAAVAAGTRRFLAVGGDGTLHEVVNGIMASGVRATLACAPLGTGNDWARGLKIPRSAAGLAALLARGGSHRCDVAEIEYQDGARRARRWFVNAAGAGFDAHVLEHLPRNGPPKLAYLAGVVRGLWHYRAPYFRVASDAHHAEGQLFVAFAMLGAYCGGGMQFAPGALPADGLLDAVTIRHLGKLAALARLPRIYRGRLLGDPAVGHWRAATLTLSAEPAARVEADGQLLGHTPAEVRVAAGAIDIVVPPDPGAAHV